MKNLTKLTASGLFASAMIFASQANAAGWGTNPNVTPQGLTDDFTGAVNNLINAVLGFILIVATLMIIYGGVLYLTSAGNEDSAARAKRTVAYGVVGLVVIGLAWAITQYIPQIIGGGGGGANGGNGGV